jgi:hypothetical protein
MKFLSKRARNEGKNTSAVIIVMAAAVELLAVVRTLTLAITFPCIKKEWLDCL